MNSSLLIVSFFLLAVVMIIIPIPPYLIDVGIAVSFALAVLIMAIVIFSDDVLDFSSFSTLLLASVVLRLSLNISSTKLIIGQGHTGTNAAGEVIYGFANFIMQGSLVLGLITFLVLLIVNFLVITKGSGRMAEVSARFALDGLPGKQLAIDSDVSSGAIGHSEARERRAREHAEVSFFGSLDGASKFVKGDAVAGLIITFLNLIAGVLMGLLVHSLSVATAFETYAILTVGDGLVSQIPAVIVSIATALLLARNGGRSERGVFAQVKKFPQAIQAVAVVLGVLAIMPGLPFIPFFLGALLLGAMGAYIRSTVDEGGADDALEAPPDEAVARIKESISDVLELEDLHIEFAPNLVSLVLDAGAGLDARITNMRTHIGQQYGIVLPEVRLTDNFGLLSNTYVIRIHGVEVAKAEIYPDRVLVLAGEENAKSVKGIEAFEPVYGAPGRWIEAKDQEAAILAGSTVVTPVEVLATHLLEVVKKNLSRLFSVRSFRRLLEELGQVSDTYRAEANRKMLDDFIPDKIPLELLHTVLRLLLEEQVSIRNIPLILEATAEARAQSARAETICEHVRQRLGFQLVGQLKREDGSLPLVQLAPEWDQAFDEYQIDVERGLDVALPPELFARLGENLEGKLKDLVAEGTGPAVVTNTKRRRFLQAVMRARGLNSPVLSFEEIGVESNPVLVGVIAA